MQILRVEAIDIEREKLMYLVTHITLFSASKFDISWKKFNTKENRIK